MIGFDIFVPSKNSASKNSHAKAAALKLILRAEHLTHLDI
jgi:hypothetical protein